MPANLPDSLKRLPADNNQLDPVRETLPAGLLHLPRATHQLTSLPKKITSVPRKAGGEHHPQPCP